MADLSLEATALIGGSFASYPASRDAVVADAENAPYLCSLLNAFAAQFGAELRVSTEVTAGAAQCAAQHRIAGSPFGLMMRPLRVFFICLCGSSARLAGPSIPSLMARAES
jgi:hypothetical protein